MRLQQVTRGFAPSEALRSHVARRLQFAVGRFGPRIRRVSVRLSDVNGPRGGMDKQCKLGVDIDGLEPIVVTEVTEDMYASVDAACGRLGRVVARRLARRAGRGGARPRGVHG